MDRHIFPDHATLVNRSLKGLVASHPNLALIPAIRTVYNAAHDTDKVSLICGGGAGHEPGSTGFVGRGFLSASVSGDTFASPSAKQVLGAIRKVPSNKGIVVIITNYTGDNLHFGLAAQQARASGVENIAILPVGDDVSVGRTKGALVGRRALAGTILVCKILGAASELSLSFQSVLRLGQTVTSSIVSIACTLGHCHVPGRDNAHYSVVQPGTIEIGLGLHNEPGAFVVEQPPPDKLVARMLDLCLNQDDKERAFVPFTYGENIKPSSGDEVVLFVNNMGGMSVLEMYAVVDETISQLEKLNIRVRRSYCGSFMTSLNAPGFSITLWNLTHNSRLVTALEKEEELKPDVSFLLSLVDAPHGAAAWPSSALVRHDDDKRAREEKFVKFEEETIKEPPSTASERKIFVDPAHLRHIIRAAALEVFAAEPDLTKWDTIVGDGDCGETCANGAKAVLKALDEGLGNDGELVSVLRELTEIIDDTCGGTLGAIYSIFLAALTAEVRALAPSTPNAPPPPVDIAFWGLTASRAIETLKLSTKARVGHRTVMDALIPFAEGLAKAAEDSSTKGDVADEKAAFAKAEEACRVGGEGTASLKAKLGRATYVGGDGDVVLPPDPGAMSLVALARGMGKVLRGEK
ncbi:hypothetical protein V5O48_009816 [Marasmius crinis-equi]|uniref:Dihydroxyacetone kinase n=1 Tax=Marasmius crinis-equi TaxID=585013 RepID=A0ABR3FAP7_9AGAR